MNPFLTHKIPVSGQQEEFFEKLFDLFSQWNHLINLSSIREKKEIYLKHFVDSLLPVKHFDFHHKKILDLGAGGGFPCLPLSIWAPTAQIHALDSVGKKMRAVQDMADKIPTPLQTHHGRIEEYGQNKNFREQFDIVTARALAPWPVLLEYALPFVKIGGFFLAYQGPQIHEDLNTYKNIEQKLGGKRTCIIEENLENTHLRVLIQVTKRKATPPLYPRATGIPKKNPLK